MIMVLALSLETVINMTIGPMWMKIMEICGRVSTE